MKIPESIRIGGIDYSVKYVPNLNDSRRVVYGQIDFKTCVIKFNSAIEQSAQARCIVMWHEILHGIAEHANLEIEDEENVIDTLAKGVYQVLQDNGRKLFDIKGES